MNGPMIALFGNMTVDPEQRYTRNESIPYARIRVACNRYMGPEKPEEVYYFSANLWHSDAERCMRHCRKGSHIFIQGHYSQEEYSRRDGSPGIDYHVNVREFEHFEWLRGRRQPQEDGDQQPSTQARERTQVQAGTEPADVQAANPGPANAQTAGNDDPWDGDNGELPVEDC